ncbi:hypothetical protein ACROYT_G040231 [Oculina patagonica]
MAAGEYLVCFSEKCEKEDVKKHIIECLTLAKLSVTREEFEGKTLLTIGAPFEVLAQKAEEVGLEKTTKTENRASNLTFDISFKLVKY